MKLSDLKKYGCATGSMEVIESAIDSARIAEKWLQDCATGPKDETVTQAMRMAIDELNKSIRTLEHAYQDVCRARTVLEESSDMEQVFGEVD